jgi:hypothetical protein
LLAFKNLFEYITIYPEPCSAHHSPTHNIPTAPN